MLLILLLQLFIKSKQSGAAVVQRDWVAIKPAAKELGFAEVTSLSSDEKTITGMRRPSCCFIYTMCHFPERDPISYSCVPSW